jgi:hypothetical protein
MADTQKYAKLVNGTLHPAPRAVRIGAAVVCNPTPAQYEAAGYKRVIDSPPTTDAAHYAVPIGWAEIGGEIVRQYEVRAYPPPPPRVFSKLRIVAALTSAGVWDSVKQLLIERSLYDLFLAAQDFAEDNEFFAQGRTALQSDLGWTDEQVEAVLAAAEGGV